MHVYVRLIKVSIEHVGVRCQRSEVRDETALFQKRKTRCMVSSKPDLLDQMGREVTILRRLFSFGGSCSFIHL